MLSAKKSVQTAQPVQDLHMFLLPEKVTENAIYRGDKEKQDYYFNYGRTKYYVMRIHFYDESGTRYKFYSWYALRGESLVFTEKVKRKPEPDYQSKTPHIVSEGRYAWSKHARCVFYVPMSYLEEIGYEIVERDATTPADRQRNVKKTSVYLETPYFSEWLETREEEDFEAQKKALLAALDKAKSKADVAKIFFDLTTLHIPNQYFYD